MENIKVKLGTKASIFHDPSIGITLKEGEVAELTAKMTKSIRVQNALNGGHIVVVNGLPDAKPAIDVEALKTKFIGLVEAGKEASKIAKAFNMEQMKALVRAYDIEPEETDTKDDLVSVLMEELAESTAE